MSSGRDFTSSSTAGWILPSAEEVAFGWVLPTDSLRPVRRMRGLAGPPSPRQALEAAVTPALRRPPCIINFSGGRDSSLILAVAAQVARRDGLPLPVPRTRRFGADGPSGETDWQELVIEHLKLPDWEIVDCSERLDLLGDVAQRFLIRYGVVFPALFYALADSLESARGGSHMTGEGGDEILGSRRSANVRFVMESPRRAAKAFLRSEVRKALILGLTPRTVRKQLYRHRIVGSRRQVEWLRPDVAQRMLRIAGRSNGSEPLDYRDGLAWELAQQVTVLYQNNISRLAADYDVLHIDPLLDRSFVEALGRAGGRWGFRDRSAVMEYLAADILPPALLRRQTKAVFNTAYFGANSRRFVETWDGRGLDESLVYPEALRREWSKDFPSGHSFMLLQTAWLATRSASG